MSTRTHLSLVANTLVCSIISGVFGVLDHNLIPWMIGGVLVGAVLGALAEFIFTPLRTRPRLYRRRILIVVSAEALLVVYLVVPIYTAYRTVHPVRIPAMINPGDLGMTYQDVKLETQDGLTLAAWYVPARNGAAVIAVHGFNGNRTHVIYHTHVLAQQGYGVLALDMRAHGESDGNRFASSWTSDLDVLTAVDYLRQRPEVQPNRIGALGLSAGAHAIIYAAARSDSIKALWADGTDAGRIEDAINPFLPEIQPLWFMTPMPWMTDRMVELLSGSPAAPPIREQVKRIAPRPMMFIAAGQTQYEISLARRYTAAAGPTAQVWELPEATHISGIFTHSQEYAQRMVEFFDKHLLGK